MSIFHSNGEVNWQHPVVRDYRNKIEGFIDYWTSDEPERERMRSALGDYISEDHTVREDDSGIISVLSSHGTYLVRHGQVPQWCGNCACGECPTDVVSFDFDEFCVYWGLEALPKEIDILDLGGYTANGVRFFPDRHFREMTKLKD